MIVDISEKFDPNIFKDKYLKIVMDLGGAGFFVFPNYVINHLIWAEEYDVHDRLFVYFDENDDVFRNKYYDASAGENMWEYYFEPISNVNYNALPKDKIIQLSPESSYKYLHETCEKSVFVYPHGEYSWKRKQYDKKWYYRNRLKANEIINKYINVKPHILAKVDTFCGEYFSDNVLGIHIRGTDKVSAVGGRIVEPEEYFRHIDDYLRENRNVIIFCATDSDVSLDIINKRYGNSVVSYNSLRSEDNVFMDETIKNNYKKGEDALMDCLLLSRCSFLLKSSSALSEFAVYFNLALHENSLDLQYINGPYDRQRSVFGAEWGLELVQMAAQGLRWFR